MINACIFMGKNETNLRSDMDVLTHLKQFLYLFCIVYIKWKYDCVYFE